MWAWNELPETRMLLCYNLNNSKNKIDGNINKGKGLIAGRSDFDFYWNQTVYFIEMKTETGIQSPEQKAFQRVVENSGFEYTICRNLTSFKSTILGIINRTKNN